jgi:hypothetical protein
MQADALSQRAAPEQPPLPPSPFSSPRQKSQTKPDVLSFDGDTAVGELGGQTTALQRWAESDTWNAEVEATVTATGQIPSATYLLTDDPVLGTPVALNNASAIDDCDGEVCQMGLSTVCKGTQRVTATRTDYDSEEAYRQLSAAGQAAGAP